MEMDLSDKDNFNPEKRNEDHLNYHSSSIPPSWQFDSTNLTDQPMGMGLLPMNNSMSTCPGDAIGSSTISSVPMMDSFSPNLWGNPSSQNITLGDNHIHASASVGEGIPGASRTGFVKALDLDWNLRSSMPKEGLFLPQTLSQFPADSAFIERAAAAARFSCFTSGPFSDIVNPFSESMNPHFKDEQATQAPHEAMLDDRLNMKPTSGAQSLINESNMTEIAKYVSEPVKQGSIEGSPTDKPRRMGGFIKSPDEEKLEIGISSNDSYEAEVSGTRGQGVSENANGEPSSSKGCASKTRRKSGQVADMNKGEAAKDNNETAQKNDQSAASTAKASKNSQDSSPNSDAPKEDYIHVRARRGQATNSHSLAERVRREKISERMKFLQDLVPGCSKVTGKAVMLDEIINYVQSLQRQVEFLSMKLASVNPCLDAHTEGLLAKDVREVLQLRDGSSSFPFSRDTRMVHPQGNPPPQGLVQLMAVNGGFKGPTPQIPSAWEEELNNVMQMNFGTNASFNEQDTNASRPTGDRKDEL